jgi:hypothetical protein
MYWVELDTPGKVGGRARLQQLRFALVLFLDIRNTARIPGNAKSMCSPSAPMGDNVE